MKRVALFFMMIQLILSPISAQGSIPAFVCQTFLKYSAQGDRETKDQNRWRREARQYILDFVRHHSINNSEFEAAEAFESKTTFQSHEKVIGVSSQDKTGEDRLKLEPHILELLISAANALNPDSNAIAVSAWHTADGDEMEKFGGDLFEARDHLIPFFDERRHVIIPNFKRIRAFLGCGVATLMAFTIFFFEPNYLSFGCVILGIITATLLVSSGKDPFAGLEINQFLSLKSAIETLGSQFHHSSREWAYLYLGHPVRLHALTYWDPVAETRRLIVVTHADPEDQKQIDRLQESFESFDFFSEVENQ